MRHCYKDEFNLKIFFFLIKQQTEPCVMKFMSKFLLDVGR